MNKQRLIPKPLRDLIDDHSDVVTLEQGSKHLKVRIRGEMVAVYSYTKNCTAQTLRNSVARLKRELRMRGLYKENK